MAEQNQMSLIIWTRLSVASGSTLGSILNEEEKEAVLTHLYTGSEESTSPTSDSFYKLCWRKKFYAVLVNKEFKSFRE